MSLPYYPHYPKDFLTDAKASRMSLAELGLYLLCLDYSWINDGLPADEEEVQKTVRISRRNFQSAFSAVEPCFPIGADGRRRNPRQERERDAASKLLSQRRDGGIRSGESRREKSVEKSEQSSKSLRAVFAESSKSLGTRAYVSGSSSVVVETSSAEKALYARATANGNGTSELHERYVELLASWPNPVGVDEGARQWISMCETHDITLSEIPAILAGLERWVRSKKWADDGGRYRPKIARWLQDKRWLDDPPAVDLGEGY